MFVTQISSGHPPFKAFVNVHQIKDHLSLLHKFAELRASVEGTANVEDISAPHETGARWPWFVGLAVERFDFSFACSPLLR
ncbi:hypothetical protein R3P38DRAFT_2918398 [Favolaschia claudopus]|uniref:Uncharacterized protein n=1 Tax=Favolaschia claudopus TaxID=2862362 RepID=A0AAW0BZL5_9AGAR